ncbi:hypothetical protein [Aquipuribacter sp. SD81]|uniref:hypothetical protein n=1 Tax=Aquipuribacter sp. SD81 TaxID=3127703 RepID=UPI003015A04B
MILLALLVVPLAALGLVLGMDRVEDQLLKQPARHRSPVRRSVDARPATVRVPAVREGAAAPATQQVAA